MPRGLRAAEMLLRRLAGVVEVLEALSQGPA